MWLAGWSLIATAYAQPPPTETSREERPDAPSPGESTSDSMQVRAERIVALLNGTLDPAIDAAPLLVVDLGDTALVGANGERLTAILGKATERPVEARPSEAEPRVPRLDGLEPAAALEAAYVAFLRLPAEGREAVLAAHANKQAAARAEVDEQRREVAAREATIRQADRLQAYMDGTLEAAVDPLALTTIDLTQVTEIGLSPSRRSTWLAVPTEPNAPDASQTPGASNESLAAAEARLDRLRRRYLAASDPERAAWREAHQRRTDPVPDLESPKEPDEDAQTAQVISNAEEAAAAAAAARAVALETARKAKTEAKRILAEERARLLGLKEDQARYEAGINRRKAERTDNHEKALEWSRRVAELGSSPMFTSEKAERADPMYTEIRADLGEMRDRLRQELGRIRDAGDDVPAVGEGLDKNLPSDVDRGDLEELRAELRAGEHALTELEQTVGWELAQGLRDDVVLLNQTRLRLLEMASSSLRVSVTGFGDAGVSQVKRELDQISVELGFRVLKLPRYRKDIAAKLRRSPIPLLIGAVQFVLLIMAYLWWRRRGGTLLTQLHQILRAQRPNNWAYAAAATTVWYLQRIRRPLELLLLLWLIVHFVGDLRTMPELALLWIVALWVLFGLTVILFVDGLAAQETLYSTGAHDTSALRLHSLRLVGLNVIAVGLILSLTSAIVGKGAIYSWVFSTCWLLSLPVVLYLVHKWRAIIFERIKQRSEQHAFTQWVVGHQQGIASFPAATAGAVYLLVLGLSSWVMRQLSGLDTTRHLLAYLFRREVAKQAAATEADGRYTRVSSEVYAVFNPERVPAELLEDVAQPQLELVASLAVTSTATLSAVVAERGAGKSTFLKRLASRVGGDRVWVLSCPEEGWGSLVAQLAELTGDATLRGPALSRALRELGPRVIAVDDVQRLVIPAVNGMRGLDDFTAFARSVAGEISWVISIGAASWHYIRRARGDRIFFEQVVMLPRWPEEKLGELIQAQCARAGIEPSFDGLVVPRQSEAPLPHQGSRTEAGYYRLLWDFSRGNPAVALHAFRESLFVTPEGRVVVRLFKEPSPEQIEDLSMSVLFVLRTIVQLELAMRDEVEAATQLPTTDVEDAFRFCLARGYIEPFQGGVRLTWPWYRTIVTVLQRQHLLSSL